MKNTLSITTLAVICFLFSCKKETSNPGGNTSSLPKTYTEDVRSSVIGNSITTYNLTYDGDNRLISLTATTVPPVLSFIYAYPSSTTFTMDMYNSGEPSIHEDAWLNASSKLDSTFQFNDTGDTTTENIFITGISN